MSDLLKKPRKYNTWQLMHSITGWSKDYCKKVVMGKRNRRTEGAKEILEAFKFLERQLLKAENK